VGWLKRRSEKETRVSSGHESLRVGIPSKGRLSELAGELLRQAGLPFRRQERSLFARVGGLPVDLTFLRTEDIPVLCAEGAIDMGITGSDLVAEANVDVQTRMALGVGRCRLSICIPEESKVTSAGQLHGLRIATSFPRLTEAYLAKHQAKAHLVPLSGSVEVMVALGVADAIVDLVETGSTLAANRLRILEDIGQYETILIQRGSCRDPLTADRIVRRLEGVVIARDYSLLEYNVRREQLQEAERITPGFNSPTVNALEDPSWCAVRVMVRRQDVIAAMERLEALGASAILETSIANCRL
jgi:ATP phosphoribosyltransferase